MQAVSANSSATAHPGGVAPCAAGRARSHPPAGRATGRCHARRRKPPTRRSRRPWRCWWPRAKIRMNWRALPMRSTQRVLPIAIPPQVLDTAGTGASAREDLQCVHRRIVCHRRRRMRDRQARRARLHQQQRQRRRADRARRPHRLRSRRPPSDACVSWESVSCSRRNTTPRWPASPPSAGRSESALPSTWSVPW